MRVVLFGASGMVGQGVLEERVRDQAILDVLVVGRSEDIIAAIVSE